MPNNPVVKKKIKREKFKVSKPNTPVKNDCPIPMRKPDSEGSIKPSIIKKNVKKRNVNGG